MMGIDIVCGVLWKRCDGALRAEGGLVQLRCAALFRLRSALRKPVGMPKLLGVNELPLIVRFATLRGRALNANEVGCQ